MAKKAISKVNYEEWWKKFSEINKYDPGTRWRTEQIIDILSRYKIKTLIDLGAGAGELLGAIRISWPEIELFGVDLSKEALKELENKKIAKKTYTMDLERPVTLPSKFNAIISSEVIEHLDNWRPTFKFISEIASSGSIAIITTQSGKIYPHVRKMGHLNHFTTTEITRELEANGFKIISARNFGRPFMDLKNVFVSTFMNDLNERDGQLNSLQKTGMKIFYYLYKYFSPLPGPQLIVVAQKT